jgi:lipase chaperone LimK
MRLVHELQQLRQDLFQNLNELKQYFLDAVGKCPKQLNQDFIVEILYHYKTPN